MNFFNKCLILGFSLACTIPTTIAQDNGDQNNRRTGREDRRTLINVPHSNSNRPVYPTIPSLGDDAHHVVRYIAQRANSSNELIPRMRAHLQYPASANISYTWPNNVRRYPEHLQGRRYRRGYAPGMFRNHFRAALSAFIQSIDQPLLQGIDPLVGDGSNGQPNAAMGWTSNDGLTRQERQRLIATRWTIGNSGTAANPVIRNPQARQRAIDIFVSYYASQLMSEVNRQANQTVRNFHNYYMVPSTATRSFGGTPAWIRYRWVENIASEWRGISNSVRSELNTVLEELNININLPQVQLVVPPMPNNQNANNSNGKVFIGSHLDNTKRTEPLNNFDVLGRSFHQNTNSSQRTEAIAYY